MESDLTDMNDGYSKFPDIADYLATQFEDRVVTPATMIGAGAAAVIAVTAALALVPQSQISGTARIVDGDTLEINRQRIRLFGIDAPEFSQLGGADAMVKLKSLTTDKNGLFLIVSCTKKSTDRYERIVAICSANGNDLGAAMVRSGYAMDWPKYSNGLYAAQQIDAKQEGAGLWRTPTLFMPPWEYRHAHKAPQSQSR